MSRADDATDTLRARLGAGDATALVEIERRYRLRLVRFCMGYLDDADLAEDAAQDVFARVIEAPAVPDRLEPWLLTLARNHCLNLRRGRARRRDGERLPTGPVAGPTRTGFLTALVRGERQQAVDAAFAQIPETEQEALRLRYAEGLSRSEIAEVVGVAESVVKSRLFEGLRRLRARLGEAG